MEPLREVLLFDMDNVLIEPHGYQRALQETISVVGRHFGFAEARLTVEDIACFEAAGSTSEWDTAAICTAVMLARAWEHDPGARPPGRPAETRASGRTIAAPDFQAFARELARTDEWDTGPRERAEVILLARSPDATAEQRAALVAVLRHARDFERSYTHRLFQEMVLGSATYARTYGTAGHLRTQGYLVRFDRAALSTEDLARLETWLAARGRRAAIFTNRPSLAPDGGGGTPEAETGARVAGVAGLPTVGLGALAWLSSRHGHPPEAYLKPSAVHALAALRLAVGDPLVTALEAAAALDRGEAVPGWEPLDGVRVSVFEDAAKGVHSARRAGIALREIGVQIRVHGSGIAASPPKVQALEAIGVRTFPHLGAALSAVFDRTTGPPSGRFGS